MQLDELPRRQALIVLCGPIGAGKTTLAARYWPGSVVDVSRIRDRFGPADDQAVVVKAFAHAYRMVEGKLALGQLAVFDSTAVTARVRASLMKMAAQFGVPAHLVVVDTPLEIASQRNLDRPKPVQVQAVEANHSEYLRAKTAILHEAWDSITWVGNDATTQG